MRYYKIELTNQSGQPVLPSSLGGLPLSSLLPDGTTNPAALNIELDIPIKGFSQPDSNGSYVRIYGLGLKDIGNAFNLGGRQTKQGFQPGVDIKIYAGMAQGLPLASPAQAGLIAQGKVFQSLGNWIGTEQTVDLFLMPTASQGALSPLNVSFHWLPGKPLSDAIRTTLQTAFPGKTININTNSNLKLQNEEAGYYQTLGQFAAYLSSLSESIVGDPNYRGVDFALSGDTISVFDSSSQSGGSIQIGFQDLIGQPTWQNSVVGVQIKTVMRADINIGDTIQLPPAIVTTTPSSLSPLVSDTLQFTGQYKVVSLHHFGNFRAPDAASWASVFDLIAITQAS